MGSSSSSRSSRTKERRSLAGGRAEYHGDFSRARLKAELPAAGQVAAASTAAAAAAVAAAPSVADKEEDR